MTNDAAPLPKPDFNSPSFRGALTCDHFAGDDDQEHSTIKTYCIAEVSRASDAVETIARIVHNSLSEPSMSGAEPLGHAAHTALLGGVEILGRYLREIADTMRRTAGLFKEHEHSSEANHD
jgi:hypothetical protein